MDTSSEYESGYVYIWTHVDDFKIIITNPEYMAKNKNCTCTKACSFVCTHYLNNLLEKLEMLANPLEKDKKYRVCQYIKTKFNKLNILEKKVTLQQSIITVRKATKDHQEGKLISFSFIGLTKDFSNTCLSYAKFSKPTYLLCF